MRSLRFQYSLHMLLMLVQFLMHKCIFSELIYCKHKMKQSNICQQNQTREGVDARKVYFNIVEKKKKLLLRHITLPH